MVLIRLRAVETEDLPSFFAMERDPESRRMAAFGAKDLGDEAAYCARWARNLGDPQNVARTVLADGKVVGNVLRFPLLGLPSVAYEVARPLWGQGVATRALRLFLEEFTERPVWARVAKDNLGSWRVLEKCGFLTVREERAFAEARGTEVDEILVRLG